MYSKIYCIVLFKNLEDVAEGTKETIAPNIERVQPCDYLTIMFILFFAVADNIMTYTVFLEIAPPDSPLSSLPSFDKDQVNT
jgi:hypothetical protein